MPRPEENRPNFLPTYVITAIACGFLGAATASLVSTDLVPLFSGFIIGEVLGLAFIAGYHYLSNR